MLLVTQPGTNVLRERKQKLRVMGCVQSERVKPLNVLDKVKCLGATFLSSSFICLTVERHPVK